MFIEKGWAHFNKIKKVDFLRVSLFSYRGRLGIFNALDSACKVKCIASFKGVHNTLIEIVLVA